MQAFASYGDVEGCYALLTRLYQVGMHTQTLNDLPAHSAPRSPASRPSRPPRQPREDVGEAPSVAGEQRQPGEQRSASLFSSHLLGAIMTAYVASSTSYPAAHHLQLFSHYSILRLAPTVELYHSLLVYHAHRQSVQSYLTSMSVLARSRHPPTGDEYIRAIRYFGLHCRDHDAALALFLHLSSLALPNATAFNSLIAVFADKGDWMMAYRLLTDMERQGQHPSAWTYASLIRALLVDGKDGLAMQLHRWAGQWARKEVEARREPWRDNCYTVLLDHHAHRGDTAQLLSTWEEMRSDRVSPERNSYTVVLRGLLAAERLEEARGIVDEMAGRRGLVLDAPTYDVALQVVAAQRDLPATQRLYAAMKALMRGKRLAMPARVVASVVSAFPPSAPTAGSTSALSLCLQLLALLRDHREQGVLPSPALLRSLLGLLRAYGAHDAAQLLEERSGVGEGERWTVEVLTRVKEAIVQQLTVKGGSPARPVVAAEEAPASTAPPGEAQLRM